MAISTKAVAYTLVTCDCHYAATMDVYCPESDCAGDDGFVCVACERCLPAAIKLCEDTSPQAVPSVPLVAFSGTDRRRRAFHSDVSVWVCRPLNVAFPFGVPSAMWDEEAETMLFTEMFGTNAEMVAY